ncbi:MAG: organic hydroperoxide resistance protein [Clostridiales bacterium]|nr:organic hydroperoxide resistance protein [Clostridiales bacterium]
MKVMYATKAIATGGRDGKVTVENSPLQFEMALPAEMGGKKESGVNPEQLFAAGYAACFGSALQHVIRVKRLDISAPDVRATVGIGRNDQGKFQLTAAIEAVFRAVDQKVADEVAAEAHLTCPYSNATRGNIEVTVTATVE